MLKEYLVTWIETHQIEVKARSETEAFEIARELAGQKDTCVDQDKYEIYSKNRSGEYKRTIILPKKRGVNN